MSYSHDNQQLYRRIIMDHYQNPRNKGLSADLTGFMTVHLKNPSCGDDLTVQLKVQGDRIEKIQQLGAGCSICCASASMMAELLEATTITEAKEIIENFHFMIQAENYDEELIGDAVSLQGVSRLPQRVKCATLAWQACERGLEKIEEKRTNSSDQESEVEGSIEDSVDSLEDA